jgi:hypothetical protein
MTRVLAAAAIALCLSVAPRAAAQQPARTPSPPSRGAAPAVQSGRLVVTVLDQTGAVLPTATVTVTGIEDATRKPIDPVTASDQGIAAIAGLAPGRYSVKAEFLGFETNSIKDTRVRLGDNKVNITLALEKLTDSVTVGQDATQAAADPHGSSFGTALTRDQIDSLSDDPDTLQQQLNDLGGPGATIRVDSFEGGQLPPKSQIKSIHVTRDGFAAENHSAGQIFVEIVTQPGVGALRGGLNTRLRNSALNGRNQITQTTQPERSTDAGFNVGGSLIKNRASFSLSMNGTNQFIKPVQNIPGQTALVLDQKQQTNRLSAYGQLDYALTKDQTLRLSYQQFGTDNSNMGIGQYDRPERAYASDNQNYQFRIQEVGPLGRRFFMNTRLSANVQESDSHAAVEAPTIRVSDAFVSGGAQVKGGRTGKTFNFASDVDYIRGIHSMRAGVQMDGGWYRSDSQSNYLGTYTFTSEDDFNAGIPDNYKLTIGDPLIKYFSMQSGVYLQDDIRVRKNLTLSPGVRWEAQTHLKDNNAFGPRFGVTWAPTKSGHTTLRASAGIFYDWLVPDTFEQTIRGDGFHQQTVNISRAQGSLPYPNPGTLAAQPGERYLLSPDLHFQHYRRLSTGIDQVVSPKLRVSTSYSYVLGDNLWRGDNLNLLVNGARPDASFSNIVQVVNDAGSHQHQLTTNFQFNLAGNASQPNPFNQSGPRFSWKRLAVNGTYTLGSFRNDADNRFWVPPTGDLNLEWGPAPGDVRHRVNMGISSQQVKNFNANFNVNVASGSPYNITTGVDDNGDGAYTDRPDGVSRNSARTRGQFTLNAGLVYTFVFGHQTIGNVQGIGIQTGPGGAPPVVTTFNGAPPRYRLQLIAQIQNVTNHPNYAGFSGVQTSPYFQQPTTVINPRKIDIGIGINF